MGDGEAIGVPIWRGMAAPIKKELTGMRGLTSDIYCRLDELPFSYHDDMTCDARHIALGPLGEAACNG